MTATTNRLSELTAPRTSDVVVGPALDCGPGQVVMRVLLNGVCASELPVWAAGPAPQSAVTLGHEPVGEVVEVGPGVESVSVGDLATGRVENSFSDYAVAASRDLVAVPAGLTPQAALGEPLGCVVETLRRRPVDVGDRVAVVGAGFMGLCLLQLLRHTPTSEVVAIDPRADARSHALEHGAGSAIDPADVAASIDERPQAQFDLVVEASGTQPGLDLSSRLVRSHGTLAIMGYHQAPRVVDVGLWNWRAIDVFNAHVRDRDRLRNNTARGLAMAAAGRIDPGALVTHRYPLEEIDRAFTALADKEPGFIKAVIEIV
jgi:threonine dehydrogenase-like Zn-dependent dehydrogenase